MKKYITAALLGAFGLTLAACNNDDAQIVSKNVSKAADNFEVTRRIVFYNGITNQYMLEIEGLCSINHENGYKSGVNRNATRNDQLEVTCKVGPKEYKKHFLGLSDNVTYFVEHMYPTEASAYHYRVTFKPQQIIPDIDFRGSLSDGPRNQN